MQRFLISRLSSLGDVTCCLPAASALKRAFPECEVTWIVDRRFADVVRCCTAVDKVIEAGTTAPEGEFDAALDLQGLLKSALPVAKAKAKRKLGYHWQREGSWLFSQRILPDPTSFHIVDQYVDVARAAGGEASFAEFSLKPDQAVTTALKDKLPKKRFVAINAGAAWATKRWPLVHFAKLIDSLGDAGLETVLIGHGQADADAASELNTKCKYQPHSMVGQTNIRELIALLDLAAAHVGGDTGSTHLTAALGRPAIGLYSITRPQRSCPYGQIERCHYDPEGLDRIEPEAVLQTVLEAVA